jgi:hypothetical protein
MNGNFLKMAAFLVPGKILARPRWIGFNGRLAANQASQNIGRGSLHLQALAL